MPGERGVDGNVGSVRVANFSHHDNVWCLPQHGAQRSGKGHTDFRIHLDLINPSHLVLDRILHRDELFIRPIDVVQAGVKCGRFAGASRTGNKQDAIRKSDELFKNRLVIRKKAQLW